MKHIFYTFAACALAFVSCTNAEFEPDSTDSSSNPTFASFEADSPSFDCDGTKITDTFESSDSTHTFNWEIGDSVTVFAYRAPTATTTFNVTDSLRKATFKVEKISGGKAIFTGQFNDFKDGLTSAYAIYPAANYSCSQHASKKTTLVFKTISVPEEQDGVEFMKYCHFIAYGATVAKNGEKVTINFPDKKKFALTETVFKFKFSKGNYKKIVITPDNSTVSASYITGDFNVSSTGSGINGTQGPVRSWNIVLKGDFSADMDIYAVGRRLDPSSGSKIKVAFKFFTNENDETPAATKTFTQKTSAKIPSGVIYNLGTIPLD